MPGLSGIKWGWSVHIIYSLNILDRIPYFLEVNTRMSGGIQMACYASGVNIPQLCIEKDIR